MRLFEKYNRINIIASVTIFLVGCIVFYFVTSGVLVEQLDEALDTEKAEIEQYLEHKKTLPNIINTEDQQVYYTVIDSPIKKEVYLSDKIWNPNERVIEKMRQLTFGVTVAGKYYKINVNKSEEEADDFLKIVAIVATIMIALIMLTGYLINRIVLKSLWSPFYQTIDKVKDYNLNDKKHLELTISEIDEFTLLNESLNNMTKRVEKEYLSLKEFTGNAAHEIQTPLAVISSHTDILMQDEELLLKHHASIATIEDATKRLSRLNQSLLLLTKIENHRFETNEEVKWDVILQQRIEELSELLSSQNIQLTTNIQPVTTIFHNHLADMVISNLLSNAIRYNYDNGTINVKLDSEGLNVTNTSMLPVLEEDKLFSRFYRHPETKSEGSGLGLSIVKQICDLVGYSLHYKSSGGEHAFIIKFNQG